jgi:hypothetical protein
MLITGKSYLNWCRIISEQIFYQDTKFNWNKSKTMLIKDRKNITAQIKGWFWIWKIVHYTEHFKLFVHHYSRWRIIQRSSSPVLEYSRCFQIFFCTLIKLQNFTNFMHLEFIHVGLLTLYFNVKFSHLKQENPPYSARKIKPTVSMGKTIGFQSSVTRT